MLGSGFRVLDSGFGVSSFGFWVVTTSEYVPRRDPAIDASRHGTEAEGFRAASWRQSGGNRKSTRTHGRTLSITHTTIVLRAPSKQQSFQVSGFGFSPRQSSFQAGVRRKPPRDVASIIQTTINPEPCLDDARRPWILSQPPMDPQTIPHGS